MSTPFIKPNTSGFPEDSQLRQFRNTLLQVKKAIHSSMDIEELKMEMEHFLNANRKVAWPHQTTGVYHKDAGEKAVTKVLNEFQRYIKDLEENNSLNSRQDLLDALAIVESMIGGLREKH